MELELLCHPKQIPKMTLNLDVIIIFEFTLWDTNLAKILKVLWHYKTKNPSRNRNGLLCNKFEEIYSANTLFSAPANSL